MAKFKEYRIDQIEEICNLGKALSSPVRLEILQLLYRDSLIIGEIAKRLNLPASSTAFHLKILEKAGLIRMEEQPGTRGSTKLCTRKVDILTIHTTKPSKDVKEVFSAEMPIGSYSSCEVSPTCGLYGLDGSIGNDDKEFSFYLPERVKAGILWSSSGFVEYKFANGIPSGCEVDRLSLSMEICSEAPGFREDWKSDITVWVNEVDCGTWTSPGDFGARRGRLMPSEWVLGSTQYGLLKNWEIRKDGCYINGEKVSDVTIDMLKVMEKPYVKVRIGNKPDAKYVGGFNIFGKHFGDYDQDIILAMEY